MKTLWIGVDPRPDRTRILAMSGPQTVVLKAHLSPRPSSRLALSALSEALCLWEGQPGRVALVATHLASCSPHAPFAEEPDRSSTRICAGSAAAARAKPSSRPVTGCRRSM